MPIPSMAFSQIQVVPHMVEPAIRTNTGGGLNFSDIFVTPSLNSGDQRKIA